MKNTNYFGGNFMMNKIKNWVKNNRFIAGGALLFVSICAIAFGFAQFGPHNNPDHNDGPLAEYLADDYDIMEANEY